MTSGQAWALIVEVAILNALIAGAFIISVMRRNGKGHP
jgi:hypothetical protein